MAAKTPITAPIVMEPFGIRVEPLAELAGNQAPSGVKATFAGYAAFTTIRAVHQGLLPAGTLTPGVSLSLGLETVNDDRVIVGVDFSREKFGEETGDLLDGDDVGVVGDDDGTVVEFEVVTAGDELGDHFGLPSLLI
jgi:hypothetical protein